MTTFLEDRSGFWRDVDVPVDSDIARSYGHARNEAVDAVLDAAIARGAITSRSEWRDRLRRNFDLVSEVLNDLPGHDATADRAFAKDKRLRDMADQFDAYLGIEEDDRVREFAEDAALPEGERMYRQFAAMTNESLA